MPREFDDDTVQLAVRVPRALHLQVRVDAIDAGITVAEWVSDALEAHLRRCQRADLQAARKATRVDGT
jgi:predicted HicB family RNase H-like nuclease